MGRVEKIADLAVRNFGVYRKLKKKRKERKIGAFDFTLLTVSIILKTELQE